MSRPPVSRPVSRSRPDRPTGGAPAFSGRARAASGGARAGSGWGRLVLTGVAVVLAAGCTASAGEPEGRTFVRPEATGTCQPHQEVGPSAAYAGDAGSDTVAMLDLLRYWNEHGDDPYCDGEPATEVDQQWADTVARLRDPTG